MKLEIEVIARETIKPSSPTPDHLRHYQLSFLDQVSPPVYNPLVLFYPADGGVKFANIEKSKLLKQSLCEALTYYYPLAGRIENNTSVDCNDEGIPYIQAHVNCQLSDVIESPVPDELNKLVPFHLADDQVIPLGIQFNVFECGGVAVGLCLSHKMGDALSTFTFIKNWAAITRSDTEIARPEFVSAMLFPPKNVSGFDPPTGITKENVVTKRFVFRTSSIEDLRAKYAENASLEGQRPPSRVETLSVFIWNRFKAAMKLAPRPDKIYFIIHSVNIRTRMDPPLPGNYFGNYYRTAITPPFLHTEGHCDDLVSRMRHSIGAVDKDYVKRIQEGTEMFEAMKEQAASFTRGELVTLSFTSLCRLPLYDADFGWDKPIWVGSPSLTFKNLVVFMDTASGDGIEALVHLDKDDMEIFQEDEDLLQFVAPAKN